MSDAAKYGLFATLLCLVTLAGGTYVKHSTTSQQGPQPVFNIAAETVKETCVGRALIGPGWLIPIMPEEEFELTVVDTYVEDTHHATAYLRLKLSYGNNIVEGLAAARYEKVDDAWYARHLDAIDVRVSDRPKVGEKK